MATQQSGAAAPGAEDPPSTLIQTQLGTIDRSELYRYGSFPNAGKFTRETNVDLMENCAIKSVVSGILGGGMGLVFGLFMGSMDTSHTMDPKLQNMALKESLKHSYRITRAKSISFARSFGVVGFFYSGIECLIEKRNGNHTVSNAVVAGCATGGLLGATGGPQAAAMGCGGFAAFSYAIEKYMES